MALEPNAERTRLEGIAGDSWYGRGASGVSVRYSARVFARHWRGGRVLELGSAEGLMTETLLECFEDVTAVDGSERFCASLRDRFPAASVVCSLFEELEPDGRFDAIVVGHVLEHVLEPRELLRRIRDWVAPGGAVYASVPNARSLHRQAAVVMGLLEHEHQLNETDLHHGHRRVYDPESLRRDFLSAGLRIDVFGGYWLKPLSNNQIEEQWTPAMLDAYMRVGERYPDIAAEIYVIASTPAP